MSVITQTALAFDFEKLFMPGEVIKGHVKFENDCQQCHVRLSETTQNELCLDCHKVIKKDLEQKKGFHSKHKKVAESECKTCHTDHKGRDANIVWLDEDRFNHQWTDYPLLGKHRQSDCKSCHLPDKKYREAPSNCYACHRDDDVHKTELGKECANCHNEKAWGGKQFDHDKTDFKLNFSHKTVSCDLCHVENKFKDTPKTCVSCHAIKDVHKNRFDNQCQDCHTEDKWNKTRFDHNRDASYTLTGKHKNQSCHSCHQKPLASKAKRKKAKAKKPRSCNSCHKLDDVHQGKNGEKCDQCHNTKSWQESSFDHDKKTKFPLKGAHKKATCQSCHQNTSKDKKTDSACYSCHKSEDVHQGEQGKNCENCHAENSWLENVRYDHELSAFPLIGQHAVVGCESCHISSTFKDVKSQCVDCHAVDDVHKKGLGSNCSQCHNPNDWLIWFFNHDETDFKIRDAHEELHCHSCHFKARNENKSKRKSRCIDCHNGDDIHDGNFGPDCDNCHTQDDFKKINMSSMKPKRQ